MTIAWIVLVEWTIRIGPWLVFLTTDLAGPCESAVVLSLRPYEGCIVCITVMDKLPPFLLSLSQVSLQVNLSLRQK